MKRFLLLFLLIEINFQWISCNANETLESCASPLGTAFCHNGGRCVISAQGRRQCSCTDEYFGAQCDYRKCPVFNPCQNGGTCEKTSNSFQCHCPLGYSGRFCGEHLENVCNMQPCANGICKLTTSLWDYECQCKYGFTGRNCADVDHCVEKFCFHGECVNEPSGHRCECDEGWMGADCREDVDECQSNPCLNEATCHNTHGSYYCQCPYDFHGIHCEIENRFSASECVKGLCNSGKCSILQHSLTSNPPQDYNETRCTDCDAGFVGPRCERRIDPCALHGCLNGGVCSHHDRAGRQLGSSASYSDLAMQIEKGWSAQMLVTKCRCPPGYKGDNCTVDVNECELAEGVCLNGGTCVNTFGDYRCVCMGGFKGARCEINEDDCEENLCYSGSECVDGIARYECVCQADRIGMFCEFENPCYGELNRCAHGDCFANPEFGNHTCQCEKGFQGSTCDEDVDECTAHSNPCQQWFSGEAKCVNTFGSFRCEERNGTNTLTNLCALNPCENGATCVNSALEEKFECLCLYGYSGERCEVREYETKNNCNLECKNGGICREPGAQNCECAPPFEGQFCESKKRNPCAQNDCKNNSTCQPAFDYSNYTCQCAPNLGGERCEVELRPCLDYNPCIYGVCRHNFKTEENNLNLQSSNLHSNNLTTLVIDDVDKQPIDDNYFECLCQEGYAGTICDLPIPKTKMLTTTTEKSTLAPISSTVCVTKLSPINNRTTIVPYDGGELNESMVACQNNGSCMQTANVAEYECVCRAGFSGEFCQFQEPIVTDKKNKIKASLRKCQADGMCKNDGVCTVREKEDGIWLGCKCKDGFAGEFCELDVNECEPEPCQNQGRCVNLINEFRCECGSQFYGDRCEFQRKDTKKGEDENLPQPFSQCGYAKFCARVFGDGKCDEACNTEKCLFDGFDCVPPVAKCAQLDHCASVYANAQCDAECNLPECGWDGGDCDEKFAPTTPSTLIDSTEIGILSGELVLILPVNESEFVKSARQFLTKLSANLRASIRVAVDEFGRPKIYKWRNDNGADANPLELPTFFERNWLNANFVGQNSRKKREVQSTRFDYAVVEESDTTVIHGIQLFLKIDVTMCHYVQHTLTFDFQCFSQVESVAQFLGVEKENKQFENNTGFPLYSARLAPAHAPSQPSPFVSIVASFSLISLCLLAVAQAARVVFKRKLVHAPVYRPPKLKNGNGGSMDSVTSYTFANANHGNNKSNDNYAVQYQNNLNSQILSAGKIGANSEKSLRYYQLVNSEQVHANHYSTIGHKLLPTSTNAAVGGGLSSNSGGKFREDGIYATPITIPFDGQNHFDSGIEATDEESIRERGNSYGSGGGASYGSGGGTEHYSTSSGVSSAATSPLDATVTNDPSNTVDDDVNKFKLHHQAASAQSIQEPIERSLVSVKNDCGRTPLMTLLDEILASKRSDQNINEDIDRLVNAGANVNTQDDDGLTPLILAIKLRRVNIVTNLVKNHRADINLCDFHDRSPIHHSIEMLAADVFALLIKQFDADALNAIGGEPLLSLCALMTHSACAIDFARQLIARRMDLERVDKHGRTALHVAASVDNVPMIGLLVDAGANKEAADEDRQTPLFLAAMYGNVGAVGELLRLGADKLAFDAMEKTPVDVAYENNHDAIKRLLLAFPSSRGPPPFFALNAAKNFVTNKNHGNNALLSTQRQQQLQQQLNFEQQCQLQQLRAQKANQQNSAEYLHPNWKILQNGAAGDHSGQSRVISNGMSADNLEEVGCPRPTKRTRTETALKKNGVKACKARRCSPATFTAVPNAANPLTSLTPPNSDHSTTYSMTPSPNNNSLGSYLPAQVGSNSANYANDQYMRQYANYCQHYYNQEQFGKANPAPLLIRSNNVSAKIGGIEEEPQTLADFYHPQLGSTLLMPTSSSHPYELQSPSSLCGQTPSPLAENSSAKTNAGVLNQALPIEHCGVPSTSRQIIDSEGNLMNHNVNGNSSLIQHHYYTQQASNLSENNLSSYWQ